MAADTIKKARVEHICQGGSWHGSCGRKIMAGERYLSLYRGGLDRFAVCLSCVERHESVAA